MARVTAFTAERMLEIENSTIVDGEVQSDFLKLFRRDGGEINAGNVRGPAGTNGTNGTNADIASVTATGLAAGAAPTVSLSGPSTGRIIALGIPKGDLGTPGTNGTNADIASVTATGLAAGAAPTATLGGPSTARTIALGIPKGDKGDTGSQGMDITPAGTISLYTGDTAPTNWLLCDGAAVSRTTYASLFSVIGVKYGAGDGSTTFNVPNLKGKSPTGLDSTQTEFNLLGKTGGTKTHTHMHISPIGMASTVAYVIDQAHSALNQLSSAYVFNNIISPVRLNGGGAMGTGPLETYTVTSSPSGTLPPYLTVNFIIKATNGDTPGDSALTTRVSTLEASISPTIFALRDKIAKLQRVFSGGGVRKVDATNISWTQRFIMQGTGQDTLSTAGFFDVDMPANGTVIPVQGHPTISSVTVTSGQIALPTWSALYYDPPIGSGSASVASRFHIVNYQVSAAAIPSNWILIVLRHEDTQSPLYMWGDGRSQDYWKNMTLTASWVPFASGYETPAWRYLNDGRVVTKGLMKNGTTGSSFFSLPTGVGPVATENVMASVASNAGGARIDIDINSMYVQAYFGGGGNQFVSLANLSWFPAGA